VACTNTGYIVSAAFQIGKAYFTYNQYITCYTLWQNPCIYDVLPHFSRKLGWPRVVPYEFHTSSIQTPYKFRYSCLGLRWGLRWASGVSTDPVRGFDNTGLVAFQIGSHFCVNSLPPAFGPCGFPNGTRARPLNRVSRGRDSYALGACWRRRHRGGTL